MVVEWAWRGSDRRGGEGSTVDRGDESKRVKEEIVGREIGEQRPGFVH